MPKEGKHRFADEKNTKERQPKKARIDLRPNKNKNTKECQT